MADKQWKHYCASQNQERVCWEEICPDCGARGVYIGWRYSVVEYMGMYASGTKLPPYGPHRAFADALLFPSFRKCPKCSNRKIVPTEDGNNIDCDLCSSRRFYEFNGTEEEFQAIRKQVLTAYPLEDFEEQRDSIPATTEPAPQPPPPADESASNEPTSPGAFFTRPSKNQSMEDFARELSKSIQKAFENSNNPQITDHRSKYTYLVKWWAKRGGTFYVRTDGIELRAISRSDVTLAVLFIESSFVASVIMDWEWKNLVGVKKSALEKYRKSIPRPERFEIIRGSAYLPIDESFTQPMFDQLMDAMEKFDKALNFS